MDCKKSLSKIFEFDSIAFVLRAGLNIVFQCKKHISLVTHIHTGSFDLHGKLSGTGSMSCFVLPFF